MKYVATFEVDFTQDEVEKFKQLSTELSKGFPETVRMCANDKADELLLMFKNNTPEKNILNEEKGQNPTDRSAEVQTGIPDGEVGTGT